MKKVIFPPQFYRGLSYVLTKLTTLSQEPNVASSGTILRCIKLLANGYVLNAFCVPGFILGTRKIAMNRRDKNPAFMELMC